jgi:hypothetical protein
LQEQETEMNRDDAMAWILVIGLTVALFFAARAGWAPRREYGLMKLGLLSIPVIIKGGHSFWLWWSRSERQ